MERTNHGRQSGETLRRRKQGRLRRVLMSRETWLLLSGCLRIAAAILRLFDKWH